MPAIAMITNGPDARSGVDGSSSGAIPVSDATPQTASSATSPSCSSRAWRMTSIPRPADSSVLEAAANAAATSSPTGVAIAKPAFGPVSRTPGVASACRPRKPAADRNASETRKTRASPRTRAAAPVA